MKPKATALIVRLVSGIMLLIVILLCQKPTPVRESASHPCPGSAAWFVADDESFAPRRVKACTVLLPGLIHETHDADSQGPTPLPATRTRRRFLSHQGVTVYVLGMLSTQACTSTL